ncbi:hypothetical protein PoB_001761800 [Plakobranchus ocellatus]|uniref:Uncharacterized protein n=1 Tax=Plakobranchus ocellatus TaxID=259542 RepID=A0AAV3Z8P8_9GAST|nr:hypothetical protein PoB_001761800 [Plakobranchus ocellatus]
MFISTKVSSSLTHTLFPAFSDVNSISTKVLIHGGNVPTTIRRDQVRSIRPAIILLPSSTRSPTFHAANVHPELPDRVPINRIYSSYLTSLCSDVPKDNSESRPAFSAMPASTPSPRPLSSPDTSAASTKTATSVEP